jgi:protein-disulfide isomerase
MTKKKREQSAPTEPATGSLRPLVPVLLVGTAAVASLLALFQWMELLVVRAGGTAACKVSEVLDCQKIWETPFASGVHAALGIPVAGLGLVWALAALGASLAWTYQLLAGRSGAVTAAALKVVAWVGLASIPVLAAVSFNAGAVCLACLTTYAVVGGFALVALRQVPGGAWPKAALKGGALWAAGLAVAAYMALLGPGLATPKAAPSGGGALANLPTPVKNPTQPPRENPTVVPARDLASAPPLSEQDQMVASFLQSLSAVEQQLVSNGVASFSTANPPAQSPPGPRRLYGAADAPVKVVEWVDFRCGACRNLNETMRELKRVAPEGSLSVEARNFPLDSECNPNVQMSDKLGIRCLAARASICLEPTKDFWKIRDRLFESQQSLTRDRILELASSGELSRLQLDACLQSPQTEQRLREDIDYAMRYNPQGTPLLVVNGRETNAGVAGPFLYALALTRGDATSQAFRVLPAPRAVDPHFGHNHGPGAHHGHAH